MEAVAGLESRRVSVVASDGLQCCLCQPLLVALASFVFFSSWVLQLSPVVLPEALASTVLFF